MRWIMIVEEHADDDPIESARLRHGESFREGLEILPPDRRDPKGPLRSLARELHVESVRAQL